MNAIYLDNSATTAAYPEVREIVGKVLSEDYGNPSSMHLAGVEAEKYIKEAKKTIARTLHGKEKEIFFTSGGTESNNWAIFGAAESMKRRGNRVVTSAIEHPSVSEPFRILAERGFSVGYAGTDAYGRIDEEAFLNALTEDTILVSVMYVNNEIGAVNRPAKIREMMDRVCPDALLHVDAVQAYGKYDIAASREGIDLLSASGHKFHGPKGTGFLYKKDGVRIAPVLFGGGQQDGLRSGTENVPGVAGIGKAAELIYAHLNENREKLYALTGLLREGLAALPNVRIHGLPGEESAPHIVSAAFMGVKSEVLLHALEDRGFYVSAGSACSTHKRTKSPTLTAIGLTEEEMASTLRMSLCEWNTEEEIRGLLAALSELLPVLRRYRAH